MCPSSIILYVMRGALNSAGVVDWPLRLYHPDEVFEGCVLSGCGVLMHRMESKQSHHLTLIRNVLFYYIKCYICNADGCSWQSAGAHYVALGFVSSFLLSVFLPLLCSPSISFICPHAMFSVCLESRSLSNSAKLYLGKMDPSPYIHDTQASMTTAPSPQYWDPQLTYLQTNTHVCYTHTQTTHSPLCPQDVLLLFSVWWCPTDLTVLLLEPRRQYAISVLKTEGSLFSLKYLMTC